MTLGRSIRLFLADGTPNGVLTAEIMNWTGHVLAGPRRKLAELMRRPECMRTGVYFLIGSDPENSLRPKVYIGESTDLIWSLEQHNRPEEQGGEDFWERVCLVTSKEQSLTQAHVKDLKRQLIGLARYAKRCELVNGPDCDHAPLSEADCSDMMFFLEHIYAVLPALGYDFLAPIADAAPASAETAETQRLTASQAHPVRQSDDAESDRESASPLFKLEMPEHELKALARVIDDRFVVLKDSQALPFRSDTVSDIQTLYSQLIENGVLLQAGDRLMRFSKDHVFSSHRTAAALICGASSDARADWLVSETGQTYAAWYRQRPSASPRVSFSSHEEWLKKALPQM